MSRQRKRDSAAAVQGAADVEDLQRLGVPQFLQILLDLILNTRGQHLLNLPQLDEELSLVGQWLLCQSHTRSSRQRPPVVTRVGWSLSTAHTNTHTWYHADDQDMSGCVVAPLVEGKDLSDTHTSAVCLHCHNTTLIDMLNRLNSEGQYNEMLMSC